MLVDPGDEAGSFVGHSHAPLTGTGRRRLRPGRLPIERTLS
jgi:hypothetical protein